MRAFSPAQPPSNRTAAPTTLLTDLIAYYRFNGNGNDSSGNSRNLSIDSGSLVPGAINSALSAGYAINDALNVIFGKELTISMWVNLGIDSVAYDPAAIMSLTTDLDPSERKLTVSSRDGTNVRVKIEYTDSTTTIYENAAIYTDVLSDDQWIHVVAVVSQTGGMLLYADGDLIATEIHPNEDFTVTNISVNTIPNAESKAGDIGIWKRALSEAEILQLYNSGNGLDPVGESLQEDNVAYYKLLDNTDSSPNGNNLAIYSGTLVPGKVDGALYAGDAECIPSSSPNEETTISCWINVGPDRIENASVGLIRLFGLSVDTRGISFGSRDGSTALIVFSYRYANNSVELVEVYYTNIVSDTQWVHVLVRTKSTGSVELFIDSILENDNFYVPEPFQIGDIYISSTADYESKIGDVGIWNRALSDAEIRRLYNSGSGRSPYPTA